MRLIDADRLKTVIDINMMNKEIKNMFNQYVDNQPTAFDVDKILEELAELAECSSQCANTFYEGLGCGACMWTDVFNIVKRGGIDEESSVY